MSKLTPEQRQQLINKINTLPLPTILKYFQSREIEMKDVAHVIFPERKEWLEEQLANMPNPIEQAEWDLIENLLNNIVSSEESLNELLCKLKAYIAKWGGICERHGTIANEKINWVQQQLNHLAEERESADWDSVDPLDKEQLMGHLTMYPNTVHHNDIDNLFGYATNKENITELNNYKILFQNGLHVREANELLNAISEWTSIKEAEDIFMVDNYMKDHPSSPFITQANQLKIALKQREIGLMRENPIDYEVDRLLNLLSSRIITEHDLFREKVITKNALNTICNLDKIKDTLPDVKKAIQASTAECKPGYKDVFFFGVPSTGKTCVLMGLSRATNLSVNLAAGGGDYAEALQQYIDCGVITGRTPGTFVTTLEATIRSKTNKEVKHQVNLVEMSGEEFAFEIAKNQEHEFSFEAMGTGVTSLLQNDNRKVFFLIIDPTADTVSINREIPDHYDEITGEAIMKTEWCTANQRIIIKKIIDIFRDKNNLEIMKKVDAIHFIITKADTLGKTADREEKALELFEQKYSNVLDDLVDLSKECNINRSNKFAPKLYMFSLGTFYMGGVYEYDQTDSDRLVKVIQHSTDGFRTETWWDKFKKIVN